MRFPSFGSVNMPQKQELHYIPVENDIALAKEQIAAAEEKYNRTKGVVEKIDLEEAKMRLELLEEELRSKVAANDPTIEPKAEAA
jgi:hypothetical protein